MNETKIILTIYMEGATLHRKSVKTKNSKGKWFKATDVVPQEIKQSIKLTKAFYENALQSAPTSQLKRVWNQIGKTKRLEYHLQEYCTYLKGSRYSYEILED